MRNASSTTTCDHKLAMHALCTVRHVQMSVRIRLRMHSRTSFREKALHTCTIPVSTGHSRCHGDLALARDMYCARSLAIKKNNASCFSRLKYNRYASAVGTPCKLYPFLSLLLRVCRVEGQHVRIRSRATNRRCSSGWVRHSSLIQFGLQIEARLCDNGMDNRESRVCVNA